jgi:hypothetical protein
LYEYVTIIEDVTSVLQLFKDTVTAVALVSGRIRVIVRAINVRLLTAVARVRLQGSPWGTCVEQSETGTGFSPIPSVFLCPCHPSLLRMRSCIV